MATFADLNQVPTDLVLTDKVIIPRAAEDYYAFVNDVAKAIIENYNGTSLAGASQTPKAAIDKLGNNLSVEQISTSLTDYADAMPIKSHAYLWSTGTDGDTVGSPAGTSYSMYFHIEKTNATTVIIIARAMKAGDNMDSTFVKQKYGGTWRDWVAFPTRAEVDTLDAKMTKIRSPKYYGSSAVSLANVTDAWALAKGTDAPDSGSGFWYVQSVAYNTDSSGHITIGRQILYGYSAGDVDKIYTRVCFNGTWTNWVQLAVVS